MPSWIGGEGMHPLALLAALASDQPCYTRADLIDYLRTEYQEAQMVRALDYRGVMVEAFVSPHGSWTLAVAPSPDVLCIVAAGGNWMMINKEIEG